MLQLEMVIRSAKHLLNRSLHHHPSHDHPALVAHFLNCLVGHAFNASPTPLPPPLTDGAVTKRSWTSLTPESLRADLVHDVESRFRYTLPAGLLEKRVIEVRNKVLRELCLRVGVQLLAREYMFDAPLASPSAEAAKTEPASVTPAQASTTTSSKKKSKKPSAAARAAAEAAALANAPPTTFTHDDVLNLVPLVKAPLFKSQIAEESFNLGQRLLSEGQVGNGQEQLQESLALSEQVFGPVHPEMAAKYHNSAIREFYSAGMMLPVTHIR